MTSESINKRDYLFNFSIVIYDLNDNLEDSLNSIVQQNIDFKKNAEIILVNNSNLANFYELISPFQSKYYDNIKIFDFNENINDLSDYLNFALEKTNGEYINFLKSGDYLSDNTLKEVNNLFNSYTADLINVPILANKEKNKFLTKYSFKNHSIDLNEEPKYASFDLGSFFIKNSYIHNSSYKSYYRKYYQFSSNLTNSYGFLFLNELLINQRKVGFAKNARYIKERVTDVETLDKKEENVILLLRYILNNLIYPSLKSLSYVNPFTQDYVIKELEDIVKIENIDDISSDKEKIDEFWNLLDEILSHISVLAIRNHNYENKQVETFLIYLKNKDFHIDINEKSNEVILKSGNQIINNLSKHNLWFDIVELRNGFLNFSANFTSSSYPETLSFEAIKKSNGVKEVYKAKFVDYFNTERKDRIFLSIPWSFTYSFDVSIPVTADENADISFNLIYNENGKYLRIGNNNDFDSENSSDNLDIRINNVIKFKKYASLSTFSFYFIKHLQIVYFSKNLFHIIPYSYKKTIKFQLQSIRSIFKDKGRSYQKSILVKVLFVVLLPFMKDKHIWLFGDRVAAADDNAEHLFKYAVRQDDNIEKYYVLGRNSPDFERMKSFDKHIVAFGSFKHKILFLFSEKLISSQVNKYVLNPFLRGNKYLYNGSILSEEYFIQHGVILHDLSSWIRKYIYNLALFVTTAPQEWDSIAHGNYKYEEDRVQLLGLPRYDKLEDDSKKQILYIPTWRRELKDPDLFINSEFFNDMKSFLKNERLHDAAKEHGYSIVFKPHPELKKFIKYFDFGEDVKVSDDPYGNLFRDSSVMITDYSSIAFDFAYLKKPLIYYQTKKFDEFHYDLGYFDYDTMGFGEVISNEEDLVDKVIYYMKNGAVLEDEYKRRSDNFFKFRDKNNSKRVYEWIFNH